MAESEPSSVMFLERGCTSNDDSDDQDDTLEAEISKLEATLSELDDLSEFSKITENQNLSDNPYEAVSETITNCDLDDKPYEDISETTITNSDYLIDEHIEIAKSGNCERQSGPATEILGRSEEKEINQRLCSDISKVPQVLEFHTPSTKTLNTTVGNETPECAPGSRTSLQSQKISGSTTSSECLSIFPSIDSDFETLLKSSLTSSIEILDSENIKKYKLEFSPFRTPLQSECFTSSPNINNSEGCQQSKITFPSIGNEIQSALKSPVSFSWHKRLENVKDQDFSIKAGNLGISELQTCSQKLADSNTRELKETPAECNLEFHNDNESSLDSVIVLKEENLQKSVSSGSFLDLDISQDYEKDWLTTDTDGKCDSGIGPISSTPYRKASFSMISKCPEFQHSGGSFIVLDEIGEGHHTEVENKISQLPSTADDSVRVSETSVKEAKVEPKNVELGDHQELNISVKCADVLVHPTETVDVNANRTTNQEVLNLDDNEEGPIKIEVIKSDYLFKSEDPQENADNFDPEWELLRKLQTDEERYKAMRERWRNLVIPDPNVDLTHHTWRLKKGKSKLLQPKGEVLHSFTKPAAQSHHKRTLSDPSSSTEERAVKRSRTQSCTMLFDVKLQQLRQQIDSEQHRLFCEEAQAVQDLRHAEAVQKVQLQTYYHGYQFMSQLQNLHHEYLQNEEMIRMQYKGARVLAESSQERKIHTLEKASAEVRAFHKFYQGLENKEDNDKSAYLSESQLEELWETENFYEECEKFYTCQ